MPYKLLTTLFILTSVFSSAQSIMRKNADKYYSQLAYIDAVDFYKNIINKNKAIADDYRKIADCYVQLFNYPDAEFYVTKLISNYPNDVKETDYINYIQVLKYNKHYQEADKIITLLQKNSTTSKIITNHYMTPNYEENLKIDSSNIKIGLLDEINTPHSEFSPTLINKSLVFASNRRNVSVSNKKFAWDDSYFLDVYQATKKDSIHFENTDVMKNELPTKYHNGPISISQDGKTMYLTRSNVIQKKIGESSKHIVNLKLFISTFDSIKSKWNEPVNFEYNSNEYSIGHAIISSDNSTLYFTSDMPGGFGQSDIWKSIYVNGKWQKPENLGANINTDGREMFPYVHNDGTLFFASDGRAGLGGLDIYFTPYQFDNYFEPQNLGYPINTNYDDFSFCLNDNMLSGYFASNRPNGKGKDDIYFFNSKTAITPHLVFGIIKDEVTGNKLTSNKIYLYDKTFMRLDSFVVDTSGRYYFSVNGQHEYEIRTTENMMYYAYKKDSLQFTETDNILDVLITPKYRLAFQILDSKTKLPLNNVTVILKNNETNERTAYKTSKDGRFQTFLSNKKIGDKLSIELKLEKDEYITIVEGIDLTVDSATVIELENPMQFNMEKIAKGINLAKVINLKPIYFDLAKWNIRPDAALELNRILKLMNENPTIKIELGSHTDCRSSNSYNLKLSTLRAKSASDYLISNGINKNRLVSKGYGEIKSISPCTCEGTRLPECTEEQHQLNRRTEFLIIDF